MLGKVPAYPLDSKGNKQASIGVYKTRPITGTKNRKTQAYLFYLCYVIKLPRESNCAQDGHWQKEAMMNRHHQSQQQPKHKTTEGSGPRSKRMEIASP